MIRVSLSGALWLEEGQTNLLTGPPEMLIVETSDEEIGLTRQGDGWLLEPYFEYIIWPDGTNLSEFRIMIDRDADLIPLTREKPTDEWALIQEGTAPRTIDRRSTVWDRLLRDNPG